MTTAPTPPGALGTAPEPAVLQDYLAGLEAWIRARRAELDELDAAALAAERGPQVASDMALSLALWKAVSDRYQLMWATWDGGRVGRPERERITALVWGRLDQQALAVSVPEACRLSDALVAQLRAGLSLVPGADQSAARIRDLRAQLERLRDQVGLEPALTRDAAIAELAELEQRLAEIAAKAERGGDVGGLVAPLEQNAATFERDLIVGSARRREARDQLERARERRAELAARAAALRVLADRCVQTVDPAPRYAVPDVDALGPVPNTPERIAAYLARLDRVGQALEHAQERYAAALAEHEELTELLGAMVAKARALGLADRPDLAESERQAREVLARRPAPIAVCRQLVETYRSWLDQLVASAAKSASPAPGPKRESA